MPRNDLAVRVLGRLEVAGTTPRSAKVRTVLAWAALHAGQRLQVEHCARSLWGELDRTAAIHRVRDAGRTLQAQLPELVSCGADALQLQVHSSAVDERVFRGLLTDLAEQPDVQVLRDALRLWRGEPYRDLAGVPGAQPAIDRLTELRLAAIERSFALEFASGFDYRVVAEVRAAVLANPSRERLWRQLAVALQLAGRSAEALREIDTARRTLARRGVACSTALDSVYVAILRGDPVSARATA